MEAATARGTRRPPWLAGSRRSRCSRWRSGCSWRSTRRGSNRIGVPQEKLAVERTVLKPDEIQLHVRNDGAGPRAGAAGDRERRRSRPFTQSNDDIGRLGGSEIDVEYPWIEGEDYEVRLLTDTGVTIDHTITAATETPDADLGFYGLMALIGLYVGVIPVAIGMLWLPWIRGVDARWIGSCSRSRSACSRFLGIEALLEGTDIAEHGRAGVRRGRARVAGRRGGVPRARAASTRGCAARAAAGDTGEASRCWATGAGLLVALRASASTTWGRGSRSAPPTRSGSLALGATLVVGFALHNTTEGLAIVAPVARERQRASAASRCSG